MYSLDARVRYSETDRSGRLSMRGLLALFQDIGYQHAEDRGLGVSYTRRTGHTYYLLSWNIASCRMPAVGEPIRVSTWLTRAVGPIAEKSLTLTDREGRTLAVGDTRWVYMDTAINQPSTPPPDLWSGEAIAPAAPMPPFPRRLVFPDDGTAKTPFSVTEEDTDTNRHVNNLRFVSLAARAAGLYGTIRSLRVEYRRQAFPGDLLCPFVATADRAVFVNLAGADGESYAVFRFETEPETDGEKSGSFPVGD